MRIYIYTHGHIHKYIYMATLFGLFVNHAYDVTVFSQLGWPTAHVRLVRLREVVTPCAGSTSKSVKVNPT